MRPPNPRLADGQAVTLTRQATTRSVRGGVGQRPDAPTTYPGFITERREGRSDEAGAPLATITHLVMIFADADPGVVADDALSSSLGQSVKALGPSYPRGAGCYRVDAQSVD